MPCYQAFWLRLPIQLIAVPCITSLRSNHDSSGKGSRSLMLCVCCILHADEYILMGVQWAIYDAYITDQEKQRAQEEANKQKAAAKKANANAETAETSQDPVKVLLLCMLQGS